MTDQKPADPKPIGPLTLTPSRIVILLMGALALTYIIAGTLGGGVSNYNDLKQARNEALASAEASAEVSAQP